MVLGIISASGFGDLSRTDGIVNAEKYCHIFSHHLIPSRKHAIVNSFIF